MFPDNVLEMKFYLYQNGRIHNRIIYSVIDLLGDIGGVFELLTRMVGLLVVSFSTHSFTLSAIKKLFLVKTTNNNLFEQKKTSKDFKNKGMQKYINPETTAYVENQELVNQVIGLNKYMRLNWKQSLQLFLTKAFNKLITGWFRCLRCKPVVTPLTVLYEQGQQKLEKHLDVVKLINDLKFIKLLVKFTLKPKVDTKFSIRHCRKSVIDLDQLLKETQGIHKLALRKQPSMLNSGASVKKRNNFKMNIIDTFLF